jgi:hypothetical protein
VSVSVDWKARAEREAAAVLDGPVASGWIPQTRESLIGLLAVAWIQGVSLGMHEALGSVDRAFEATRAEL